MQNAPRKTAIDDQMGHAFGMAARIGNGNRATLREADQDESFETGAIDHCFQILDRAFERNLGHVAL
jgi:hypothetical protein